MFKLNTCDPITHQAIVKGKYSYISTMMDVIASHNRVSMVLYPYTGQGIPTDFIVLVCTL